MRFPDAHAGIKKIFTAEILALIAILLAGIGTIAAAVAAAGVAAQENGVAAVSVGGMAIALLAAGIIAIIAFIMNLVGLAQAGKDEKQYIHTAFICTIIGLICSVIATVLSASTFGSILKTVSDVMSIISILFVCKGIMVLAEQLNDEGVASFANKAQWLIAIVYAVGVIVSVLPVSKAVAVIAVIAVILKLVSVICYLVLLARAKTMLQA